MYVDIYATRCLESSFVPISLSEYKVTMVSFCDLSIVVRRPLRAFLLTFDGMKIGSPINIVQKVLVGSTSRRRD